MSNNDIIILLIIVFVIIVIAIIIHERRINKSLLIKQEKVFEAVKNKVAHIIEEHQDKLALQRKKLTYTDAYGKENSKRWYNKEIPYFMNNYIEPALNDEEEFRFYILMLDEWKKVIDEVAKTTKINDLSYHRDMDGFEFEIFCAEKLKKENWFVEHTQRSADQGIDLIISKGKRKIGIQCKRYSTPVGNKAIQEVIAGMRYYNLDEGAVLTDNDFTISAKQLAHSADIKLVHYLETQIKL